MIIFDGFSRAADKEALLQKKVAELAAVGKEIGIAAIVFQEDAGSMLYTRLKREAAERVGMKYQPQQFSLLDDTATICAAIEVLNNDPTITGIIIQKPTKRIWQQFQTRGEGRVEVSDVSEAYNKWWHLLTSAVAVNKDVDGLHPDTLAAIEKNLWQEQGRVLPATCQAVLEFLEGLPDWNQHTHAIRIIGKSDLLGLPLYSVLKNQGRDVELLGRKDLEERVESGKNLFDATVVVSATGVAQLIKGDYISEGAVVIDVGEPRPDVDRVSVAEKASFLTPVPGGIGPMTVVCLLENALKLR